MQHFNYTCLSLLFFSTATKQAFSLPSPMKFLRKLQLSIQKLALSISTPHSTSNTAFNSLLPTELLECHP